MRSLDQIIDALPADRRARVVERGRTLIAEEMALRHLRKARDLTQQDLAAVLGIDQAGVSKIEKRGDMLISTMRNYVEAMGGSLRLTAEFPDGRVELSAFGDVADLSDANAKQSAKHPRRVKGAHASD